MTKEGSIANVCAQVPAWCDRVLWRGRGLSLVEYASCMQVRGSDHKPVVALFELKAKERVREGAEKLVRDIMHAFDIDGDAGKEGPGGDKEVVQGKDKGGHEPIEVEPGVGVEPGGDKGGIVGGGQDKKKKKKKR